MDAEIAQLRARVASLEATLERERALFTGGPVVVFRWVATEGWPVEYVSSNVEALFGYSVDDLCSGRVAYAQVVHPDDLQRVGQEVASFTEAGVQGFEQDYRVVDAGGRVRWLYDYTVVIRDARGQVTHYAGYVLDVSERREADALLRQAQKMEALGRLAGGISHDFNNLLTAVLGHAELAAATLPEGAAAAQPLERIATLVERASGLTHQLLAFARRQVLEPHVVDLSAVVRDARAFIAPLLGDPVRVEAREAATPLWVLVDPSQLEQVVVNLLLNARDSMASGRIQVSTSELVTGRPTPAALGELVPPGTWAVLAVTDEGPGIEAASLPRLFEPFYTTKERGTGLGLATVYGIVRQSRGHLLVRSSPDGATFEVWLPRVEPQAGPAPAPEPVERTVGGRERVLYVEDHEEIRELMVRALAGRGYAVSEARYGLEALERVRAGARPDVVITDLVMPRMGGVALVEALEQAGVSVPVLFVSGYARQPLPEAPERPQAHLGKPFTLDALLRALRGLLDRG